MTNMLPRTALRVALAVFILLGLGATADVRAGDLYQLEMRFEVSSPSFPVHLVLNSYKWENELKATSEADFDGSVLSNIVCDAHMCITDASVQGGDLVISYVADGYKAGGDFDANSKFEVVVGADTYDTGEFHTSCSKPIWLEFPYYGTPAGTFLVEGGDGDCFVPEGECPTGNKLYRLDGTFCVPCMAPADLTFNLYKDTSHLKATASAFFDGIALSNVQCDQRACIVGAVQDGNDLCVDFEAYGQKAGFQYDAHSRFELVVSGCGTFYLDLHTSCSEVIELWEPYATQPAGGLTLTGGCGECLEGMIPVEEGSWGGIKAIYRDATR